MNATASGQRVDDKELTYLVEAAASRLAVGAWLIMGVNSLYFLLFQTVWADKGKFEARVVTLISVAVSTLVAVLVRRSSYRAVIALSIAYEALTCLSIEVIFYTVVRSPDVASQVSWSSVVIVLFPMLMAASPRVTLWGSLLAASMAPLGYFLTRLSGAVDISGSVLFSHWLPVYLCAALAYVPAVVVHRLGRDIKRAQRLGSYELVELLGAGGMGEVWRARHRLLARAAAVKLIRPDPSNVRQLEERFAREAQATSQLESPHTVELYDFGVSDRGVYYYVMELLRGVDLEALVDRFGPLPADRTVFLLLQVCDSLDEAHQAHMVHRDIKPANIYISKCAQQYDFVKVLDFGLVKVSGNDEVFGGTDVGRTAEGKIVGTPAYLPPELTLGDQVVDGRADLYALGCVAYYLLTGRLVFTGETPTKVAVAHATQVPDPPSAHAAGIPAALESAVMQCLEKDVSARPASASKLRELLVETRLAQSWTNERARQWWEKHLGEVLANQPLSPSLTSAPTDFLVPADT